VAASKAPTLAGPLTCVLVSAAVVVTLAAACGALAPGPETPT
jgi:hypothetical protein